MIHHSEATHQTTITDRNIAARANMLEKRGRTTKALIGLGGVGLALLAACNTVDSTPTVAMPDNTVPATALFNPNTLDQALETHSTEFLDGRSFAQLQGTALVNEGANVRTTPNVQNDGDGVTNVAYEADGTQSLINPMIVEDSTNPANGPWYGAKNESGDIVWVSVKGVTLGEDGIKIKYVEDASKFDINTTSIS